MGIQATLRALADPTRREILNLLKHGKKSAGEITQAFSITAAAIGGTALTGGVGMVAGSIAGAFLIGMLSNMMNILGINHFYQYVLKGLLLVVAMIIYSLSSMVEVKKHDRA